jgi:RNA polymerase sigma-70 factor (ECF subfamily)
MAKSTTPDLQLIVEFEAGDKHAFDELVNRYYGRAMKIAFGFVGNHEQAQDVVQEAFIKAYRAIATYDRQRAFGTWFFRIVTNLCIDKLRRRKGQTKISLDMARDFNLEPASPVNNQRTAELREAVQDIFKTMPEKYVTALTLRDLNDQTCEEIAEVLNISPSTVRWRLAVARKMFKEKWQKRYPD